MLALLLRADCMLQLQLQLLLLLILEFRLTNTRHGHRGEQ